MAEDMMLMPRLDNWVAASRTTDKTNGKADQHQALVCQIGHTPNIVIS